jgi:hypothetical protein
MMEFLALGETVSGNNVSCNRRNDVSGIERSDEDMKLLVPLMNGKQLAQRKEVIVNGFNKQHEVTIVVCWTRAND